MTVAVHRSIRRPDALFDFELKWEMCRRGAPRQYSVTVTKSQDNAKRKRSPAEHAMAMERTFIWGDSSPRYTKMYNTRRAAMAGMDSLMALTRVRLCPGLDVPE